jgi:Leucine-rich repeat (LRR) protein
MNYIKPRTSNKTNTNASIITNKIQAQTIFTGYTRQYADINSGIKTARRPLVFNGSDGLTVSNLKNGNTWSNPAAIDAIQRPNLKSPLRFIVNLNLADLIGNNGTIDLTLYSNLKRLYGSGSNITSLTNLPSTTEDIDISNTPFNSFPELQAAVTYNLGYLDLSNTFITSLSDKLNLLTNLYALYVSNTLITSTPPLPDSLLILDISQTNIIALPDKLPPNLVELDISNTIISSIPTNLPSLLQYLYLTDANISGLPELPPNLKGLHINGTKITSITSLPSSVIELNISRTNIDSLTILPPGLIYLDISSTSITSNTLLSLTSLPLVQLLLSDTDFTIIPQLPSTVELLDISETNITNISYISTLPSLLKLNISSININSLPNLPNSLRELEISNTNINTITSLPPQLEVLECENTMITSLPLLPSSLISLDASKCRINQTVANSIVANLYSNNTSKGILFIKDQKDNNGNDVTLNITNTDNWIGLSSTLKWLIDSTEIED